MTQSEVLRGPAGLAVTGQGTRKAPSTPLAFSLHPPLQLIAGAVEVDPPHLASPSLQTCLSVLTKPTPGTDPQRTTATPRPPRAPP